MIEAIPTTSDSGKRLGLDFLSGFTGLSERKADLYVKKMRFQKYSDSCRPDLNYIDIKCCGFFLNIDKELSYCLHLSYTCT